MNIITVIQTALNNINSGAALFMYDQIRDAANELNYTGDTIVIDSNWVSQDAIINDGGQLIDTDTFSIKFKTLDEWDNSDGETEVSYDGLTTLDRINAMRKLANSVFYNIKTVVQDEIDLNMTPKWKMSATILRSGNGTMSGVEMKLTLKYVNQPNCNYGV